MNESDYRSLCETIRAGNSARESINARVRAIYDAAEAFLGSRPEEERDLFWTGVMDYDDRSNILQLPFSRNLRYHSFSWTLEGAIRMRAADTFRSETNYIDVTIPLVWLWASDDELAAAFTAIWDHMVAAKRRAVAEEERRQEESSSEK